ncbi:hypothetical protein NDU88_009112 [Pleurodeles waltl]|uniref:Uncharacterized protein n=1 Tax=Pleurodeles waltl TaxID=8319 RepID=A0AAV7S041_PLEWA|nr:hypothetical protein NDU88_009112 [Pleurodeles waltl]
MADRVTDIEGNIKLLQQEVEVLKQTVAALQSQLTRMEEQVENSEGCSHQIDLRIVGFPECTERKSTELFLKGWLMDTLQLLSKFFNIEKDHWALAPEPQPGVPQLAIIACFFNYRDYNTIRQHIRIH